MLELNTGISMGAVIFFLLLFASSQYFSIIALKLRALGLEFEKLPLILILLSIAISLFISIFHRHKKYFLIGLALVVYGVFLKFIEVRITSDIDSIVINKHLNFHQRAAIQKKLSFPIFFQWEGNLGKIFFYRHNSRQELLNVVDGETK